MSSETTGTLALTAQPPATVPHIELVASDAAEMQLAQQGMVDFFAAKLAVLQSDRAEVELEKDIAVRNGWRVTTHNRQLNQLKKRIEFYDKCRQASEAGYCLIPNMPCHVFAVRTLRHVPGNAQDSNRRTIEFQRSESPPAGEGKFVDEIATTVVAYTEKVGTAPHQYDRDYFEAMAYQEIDFPVSICNPRVMDATGKAMALKLFDEIAVIDDSVSESGVRAASRRSRKGDPLVIGIVRHPGRSSYHDKRVTFLISWFVDTRAL